ncbi:MAG: TIGR04222 domain-containing membrane protein [Pseudanabaena sp.]
MFAYGLRYYLRLPSNSLIQPPDPLDAYEVAYLVDGNKRVFDTAIASLFLKGYINIDSKLRMIYLDSLNG